MDSPVPSILDNGMEDLESVNSGDGARRLGRIGNIPMVPSVLLVVHSKLVIARIVPMCTTILRIRIGQSISKMAETQRSSHFCHHRCAMPQVQKFTIKPDKHSLGNMDRPSELNNKTFRFLVNRLLIQGTPIHICPQILIFYGVLKIPVHDVSKKNTVRGQNPFSDLSTMRF